MSAVFMSWQQLGLEPAGLRWLRLKSSRHPGFSPVDWARCNFNAIKRVMLRRGYQTKTCGFQHPDGAIRPDADAMFSTRGGLWLEPMS